MWIFLPVDKSITVSAPHLVDHTIFSTSSSIDDEVAEFPIFALTLTKKFLPIIIGSASGWLIFTGKTALPSAISFRTNSGVIFSGRFAPKFSPLSLASLSLSLRYSLLISRFWFSLIATNSISGVIIPLLA